VSVLVRGRVRSAVRLEALHRRVPAAREHRTRPLQHLLVGASLGRAAHAVSGAGRARRAAQSASADSDAKETQLAAAAGGQTRPPRHLRKNADALRRQRASERAQRAGVRRRTQPNVHAEHGHCGGRRGQEQKTVPKSQTKMRAGQMPQKQVAMMRELICDGYY
jgi:hypothetical protein